MLNKHKRVSHKGAKAYICVKCNKPFDKNKDMVQHKGRMHSGLPFRCLWEDGTNGCEKAFNRKDTMKRHTLLTHPGPSSLHTVDKEG